MTGLGALTLFIAWGIEHNKIFSLDEKIKFFDRVKANAHEKTTAYEAYNQSYGIMYPTVVRSLNDTNKQKDTASIRVAAGLLNNAFTNRNVLRQDFDEMIQMQDPDYDDEWKENDLKKINQARDSLNKYNKMGDLSKFDKLVPDLIYSFDSSERLFTRSNRYRNNLYADWQQANKNFRWWYYLGSGLIAFAFLLKNWNLIFKGKE